MQEEFWNDRYRAADFAYGEEPNAYLREHLPALAPGKILFPAEGEGRNGVFAAKLDWQVSAFDLSVEGQRKAQLLAGNNGVALNYRVGEFETLRYDKDEFDAIALIYAHFSAATKAAYHQRLGTYLRPGGHVIFEAFSKNHLLYNARNERIGGPKDEQMLFSVEELQRDFSPDFELIELYEAEIELSEGLYHNGKGSVVRFFGRKK